MVLPALMHYVMWPHLKLATTLAFPHLNADRYLQNLYRRKIDMFKAYLISKLAWPLRLIGLIFAAVGISLMNENQIGAGLFAVVICCGLWTFAGYLKYRARQMVKVIA